MYKKIIILFILLSIFITGCSTKNVEIQIETPETIPTISIPEIIKPLPQENLAVTIPTEPVIEETEPVPTESEVTEPINEETKPQKDEVKPENKEKEEPTITFTEVDETVYAKKTVNIRKGPGTEYEKIGSLNKSDSIKRVGVGSNGWSKVIYNGKETYISSNYLTKTKPVIENPTEPTEPVEPPQETKPQETVTYKEVNETVYAISEVGIRKGPSSYYEKISTLKKGSSVQRIGIGSNGWSKILYCGEEAYISSCYLTTDKAYEVKPETVLEEMQRRGSMGRLNILSHSVALFKTSYYDINQSQPVVDNKDSAAYMADGNGNIIIADHVHQGFSIIKKAEPNQTIATIDYGTYTEKYICTANFIGRNTGSDLVDNSGNSILGKNIGGITMYTCNIDGTVTITYWQLVK